MASWNDAPQLAPLGDYKLTCVDYLPAGSQGGADTVDIMVLNFANPKDADKYMPFRVFINDQRSKPAQLDDDTWAAIQERNEQVKQLIFEAFAFDEDKEEVFKLIGRDTGKNKLRVTQRDQGGTMVNTISPPRNPAPQGDYFLELTAADYKQREEIGMRKWLTLTVAVDAKDEEGKPYTPIRGLDTMLKFCWSKEFKPRDEETKKGFKSERDYMALVQQDAERAMRICQAFGLPKPEQSEDADNLFLSWNDTDIRALLTKGIRTKKSLRLSQTLDQQTGERFNRIHWPALVK